MNEIYLASSWKNEYYASVLQSLRTAGHSVYDFRTARGSGFSWESIDKNWLNWTNDTKLYLDALDHSNSIDGFNIDFKALKQCEICIFLMPCGVSASLEAGWAKGAGKKLVVYIPELREANIDLMVKMADLITDDLQKVLDFCRLNLRDQ